MAQTKSANSESEICTTEISGRASSVMAQLRTANIAPEKNRLLDVTEAAEALGIKPRDAVPDYDHKFPVPNRLLILGLERKTGVIFAQRVPVDRPNDRHMTFATYVSPAGEVCAKGYYLANELKDLADYLQTKRKQ